VSKVGIGAALAAFAIGVIVGAYGWARHSENQLGLKLLTYLRDDSIRQIESYEKLKELIVAGERERLVNYVDGQLEMARLSARSAEAAMPSNADEE
jgi:hypothetical protein